MTNVFVSWSGERSRSLAEATSDWLAAVLPTLPRPWISTRIEKGVRWPHEVGRHLAEADFGIVCVTPENRASPWLLFESGALSNAVGDARVCPLLFGLPPEEMSGPLSQFQAATVDKTDLLILLSTLNQSLGADAVPDATLRAAHEAHWPELRRRLGEIESTPIAPARGAVDLVLGAFGKHGIPEPVAGSQVSFTAGFESHGFYSSVMETAGDRLWIYGRKNRKVFDKEHQDFFASLAQRIADGFDFRVLFLDPGSPDHVLRSAHKDIDFPVQLRQCIDTARSVLKAQGVGIEQVCRMYHANRTAGVVVADDAVAYSTVRLDEYGSARKLTKASFSVASVGSEFGTDWIEAFESQWSISTPVPAEAN